MDTSKQISVVIGIQARSTSTRLPKKSLITLGGTSIVEHVINNATAAANFMESKDTPYDIEVALLVPEGDELLEKIRPTCRVIQGSEKNVLSRYVKAYDTLGPDFIVRLTADCPMLPPYLISNHIRTAVKNNLDYFTNADPRFRTSPDGHDVEVLSARMLEWLSENVMTDFDREHVTTMIKRDPPSWARIANSVGFVDLSDLKISIDTEDDLERVQRMYQGIEDKISGAILDQKNFRKIFRL